jgi:histidyl-tRNA synthetase
MGCRLTVPEAGFAYKVNPEPTGQLSAAQKSGALFAVVLSEGELVQGKVKIKEISNPHKPGLDVDLEDVAVEVGRMMSKGVPSDTEDPEVGGAGEDGNFRERVDRVRVQGGTVEMEGVKVDMDFARIKARGADIEFRGAKFEMKKVKIEIKGSREI